MPDSANANNNPDDAKFGKWSTGTDVAARYRDCIRGKRVLVTGVSPNSLGEAAALATASAGPQLLILASRTAGKLATVSGSIQERHPGVTVHAVVVDLASQASVRDAARRIRALTTRLDVLVNNAGVSLSTRQLSPEGVELTFATNHLGPFLLTSLLLPTLIEASKNAGRGATRIVNVSSAGHGISAMRFADFNFEGKPLPKEEQPRKNLPAHFYAADHDGFPGMVAYGASKTANILFTVALNERLHENGIRSYAVDPGDIATNIVREVGPTMLNAFQGQPPENFKNPDQGCSTMLVAAFDPSLPESDAVYLSDCQKKRAAWTATDKDRSERLWRLSETLTSPGRSSKM